jgi:GntR family transcriptional regulator
VVQILVSAGAELPIYRQIMRQISDAIAGGRLKPGDKLPSHRELGSRLVIAPLTVKKAYDELERDGVIRSERGRGTFVASAARRVPSPEQRERLRESVRALVSRAHLGAVPLDELLALVSEVHGELESERAAGADDQETQE